MFLIELEEVWAPPVPLSVRNQMMARYVIVFYLVTELEERALYLDLLILTFYRCCYEHMLTIICDGVGGRGSAWMMNLLTKRVQDR